MNTLLTAWRRLSCPTPTQIGQGLGALGLSELLGATTSAAADTAPHRFGGLPGIPLAIARSEMRVTLLDSNRKKSTFLKQAAIELELVNVRVVSSRVEEFEYLPGFDVVISRAFSDLGEFVLAARHLVTAGGLLAAMKGVYPHEELTHLPAGFSLKRSIPLEVPGVNAKRHLLLVGAT